jgi:predicted protein tyrosine phosphatase
VTFESEGAAPLTRHRLIICGLDELGDHSRAGVSHVVSILDPETPVPSTVLGYPDLRAHRVLRFHDVSQRIGDARVPEAEDVAELLSFGMELQALESCANLLIHCHAGVSRSTAAAAILLGQHAPGREREVMREIVRLRPIAWPNARMIQLADEALGREGAFIDALRRLRSRRLDDTVSRGWLGGFFRR